MFERRVRQDPPARGGCPQRWLAFARACVQTTGGEESEGGRSPPPRQKTPSRVRWEGVSGFPSRLPCVAAAPHARPVGFLASHVVLVRLTCPSGAQRVPAGGEF